jgi:hypothetical protein
MTLLRPFKRAQAKPEATVPKRTKPPAPPDPRPTPSATPDNVRAAAQEFGTGLRSRLGGDDAICW